ncbi:MAG TPA: nitroreductase family protein [Candidatus Latescibacteria bacterium]|nr:nitroreductase family protein [Candidatus Latescibacterota bacterium]
MNVRDFRQPEHLVSEPFLQRWSPRALTGEPITEDELNGLFEAAKWAPSAFNNQPWRFLYARRGSPEWDVFFDLLVEGNKAWAKNAGALILLVSKRTLDHNGQPSRTHSFDTGAAWMSFALEASLRGLAAHAMAGFNANKAQQVLGVPEDFAIEVMIAVGRQGSPEILPPDLRERERPNTRKSVSEIAREGVWKDWR